MCACSVRRRRTNTRADSSGAGARPGIEPFASAGRVNLGRMNSAICPSSIAPAAPITTFGIRYIAFAHRSEEHTSELQSRLHLVCRLLLEKKKLLAFNSGPSAQITGVMRALG